MNHQALYRRYRPKTFDDVVEQQHVVTTLKNTVISGKPAHAYLFCGTRGTGKTTMAKILARAVNCLEPEDGNPCNKCEVCTGILSGTILDVIEMDAASNNSVDNVRDIIDEMVYTPSQASYKIYIIDEVHMLSSGAFNALLKTLEEPPEHVLFILATTEPNKLPATVLSRCQRFDFRRISTGGIMERLLLIAKETGINLTDEAAYFLASLAEGALRDGISLLDQCISTGRNPLELKCVYDVLGIARSELVLAAAECLIMRDEKKAVQTIDQLYSEGKEPTQFLQSIIRLFRDIIVYKTSGNLDNILCTGEKERERIPRLTERLSMTEALTMIKELSDLEAGLKWSASPRILTEMTFLRICTRELDRKDDSISDRIRLLEDRIRHLEDNIKLKTENYGYEIYKQEEDKEEEKEINEIPAVETIDKGSFSEWNRVIDELRSAGRMKVYSGLVGTSAVWIDKDTIGIVISEEEGFRKKVIEKAESMEIIENAIELCSGQRLNVRIVSPEKNNKSKDMENIPETVLDFVKKNGIKLDIVDE
ncbi:MAG: DNA polymerase III subunit gamma/tau [Bacillota bacterium]|nr:DNA polymerase III subunit gamma/tau [Bacillota bacterium]